MINNIEIIEYSKEQGKLVKNKYLIKYTFNTKDNRLLDVYVNEYKTSYTINMFNHNISYKKILLNSIKEYDINSKTKNSISYTTTYQIKKLRSYKAYLNVKNYLLPIKKIEI